MDRWEIFEKFCYNGGNKLGRKVSFMDDKDKLELEIARLKMENENLRLKTEVEQRKNNKYWLWALVPIVAILAGNMTSFSRMFMHFCR